MNRADAEKITTEYLKPIFAFALKRCKSREDAEDLSQEIALKVFRTLCARDNVEKPDKYIWAIAHNTLANYYRDASRSVIGVSLDSVMELAGEMCDLFDDEDGKTVAKLQREIAYLSKLQRKIVIAYYFENKKQADIARDLALPLSTVKWHLFDAKKELKRGIDKMRNPSQLKFNPIKFAEINFSGIPGTDSVREKYLSSALAQNICYCVKHEAKTLGEIADDLGVSPVYVESEIEKLTSFNLLTEEKGKYLLNFIIDEYDNDYYAMQDEMYKKAARLFVTEAMDELLSSGILDDEAIKREAGKDRNFLLWALIAYISSASGENLVDKTVTFDEVATLRPDGGRNIVVAEIWPDKSSLSEDFVEYYNGWCGPSWYYNDEAGGLWEMITPYSDRADIRHKIIGHHENIKKVMSLYKRSKKETLSVDEYAFLAEEGYIKISHDENGNTDVKWLIVSLENREIQNRLVEIGNKVKEKHKDEIAELRNTFTKKALENMPSHLRNMKYFLYKHAMTSSDGLFVVHCLEALVREGKLCEPSDGERRALCTLILPC